MGSQDEENLGLIQPTFIQQVKNILDQYPDDGQILKELIQNAEDADASEIKFLFDQHSYGTTQLFRPGLAKFQGPALYAYNNAKFSDGDWRGIRMLCDSIKVKDPMKVGRFGLGFKSVFHLTDLPSVISDYRLLVIDPQEKFLNDKQTVKAWHLGQNAKIMSQIPDQFAPYKGIFNCSEESFRSGNYEGTLFRFPLRQEGSVLSETLYSKEKIHGLLECFKTDSSLILLFLKNIENIELYERGADDIESKKIFQVKIADECLQNVRCKRREFTDQVREARSVGPEILVPPVKVTYSITIQTVRYPATGNEVTLNHAFMVTHYFSGNDVSSELKSLITDESLSYMPWVGVAMPLTSENNDGVPNYATRRVTSEPKGHIFCFLPLPLETRSLTGLPVHVNGFFALSQNRRHLKWPSADQDESAQPLTDKALLWNKCLLQEVVPRAYAELILQAIDLSQLENIDESAISIELGNGMSRKAIYTAWPDTSEVDPKWQAVIVPLFEKLFSREVLYTEADGGKWLKVDDVILDRLKSNDDTREVVIDAMLRSNQNVVTVPRHVTSTIVDYCGKPIKCITPGLVRDVLRSCPQCYANFSYNDKLLLLEFVLRETNFEDLHELTLLPLSDKTFTNFSSTKGTAVYIPSPEHPQSLLPGLQNKFIDPQLVISVVEQLKNAAKSGKTQIRHLDKEAVASLLPDALPCEWSTTTNITWYPGDSTKSHPPMEWLREVWSYLAVYFKEAKSLAIFQGLPLIPVSLNTIPVQLERLKFPSSHIVCNVKHSSLPDNVARVLRLLGLTMFEDLPKYVSDHPAIFPLFLNPPTPQGVVQATVEYFGNTENQIMFAWKKASADDTRSLRKFLSRIQLPIEDEKKKVLRKLPLFETIEGSGKQTSHFVSCDEVSEGIAADDLPPVPPLKKLVDLREQSSSSSLAHTLEVKQLQTMALLCDMLEDVREHKYSDSEVDNLMRYTLEHLPVYSNHELLREKLKTIPFVPTSSGLRKIPRELFDPERSVLRKIFSQEEDLFPCKSSFYSEPRFINELQKLGLKREDGITAFNICQSAEIVNSMEDKEFAQAKSEAILDYLSTNPQLLNGNVGCQKLGHCLKAIPWVSVLNRKPETYPKGLPLKNENQVLFERPESVKSETFIDLIGTTKALICSQVSGQLSEEFGWNLNPCLDDVLQHLKNVISSYDVSEKALFIKVVKAVYHFLDQETFSKIVTFGLNKWDVSKWVWNGDGFSFPIDVVLEKPCMDLSPYVCPLPAETKEYNGLFSRCGMKTECDQSSLLDVVSKIRDKHEKSQTSQDVRRDLQLSINILNELKPKCCEVLSEDVRKSMLIPIDVDGDDTLKFALIQDCTYCDLEWLKQGHDASDVEEEEDEEIRFIHRNIPIQTAIDLGVPTLMSRMLEAEELDVGEGFGQSEPLTRRLNRLLEEYTDGFSVPKELIQNADDAGATEVRFLYDERTNEDAMTCLIDEGMKGCQGPALWTYNDAVFSENDFHNITKLNGATKEEDAGMIGRFGLGFNAVYNLTDVPSFVSGNNIVIFDPHTTYLGRGIRDKSKPGIKVDLSKNKRKLRKLANQFKPFNGIFGCDLRADGGQTSYNGTLFRFPLRTKDQAKRSEIKALHYDDEQVKELLKMLVNGAESLLLFTQNVCKVSIYHLPKGSCDTLQPVELFCIMKSETRVIQELKVDVPLSAPVKTLPAKEQAFIKQCSILKASSKVMKELQDEKSSTTGILIKSSMVLRVQCNVSDIGKKFLASDTIAQQSTPGHWLVTSCMVGGDALQLAKSNKSLIPTAGVAAKLKEVGKGTFIPMPIEKYIGEQLQPHNDAALACYNGRIFCFLPLPIYSGLPVNINGSFAIDANRRHLREKTEDDKSDFAAKWNGILMEDAVCQAYLSLLEDVKSLLPSGDCGYEFHSLWPRTEKVQPNCVPVANQFYEVLCDIPDVNPPSLFSDGKDWSDLRQIVFLDPAVRTDKVIGPSALKAFQLLRTGKDVVIDMPEEIFRSFEKSGCTAAIQSHCFDEERVYREVFFPAIEASEIGDNHLRDELVLYALDDARGLLSTLVANHRCIPVSPDGQTLMDPKALIHPHGKAAALFCAEDGKFPHGEQFVSESRLHKLVQLGMRTDDLEWGEIIERAESVNRLNVPKAYKQAIARTRSIISFIGSKLEKYHEVEEGVREKIQQIEFLPVLKRQKKTPFKWKSDEYDSTTLLAAKDLYLKESKRLVGVTTALLNDYKDGSESLPDNVRNFLNMEKDVTLQQVKAQLETVIATDLDHEHTESFDEVKKVCNALYSYFHSNLKNESFIKEFLMPLKFILVERHFVSISKVAFTCEPNLSPYLYELPTGYAQNFPLLFKRVIKVRDSFSLKDYLCTLQEMKFKYQERKLDDGTLDVSGKTAHLLERILTAEHSLEEATSTYGPIYLPDSNAVMRKANELSIKDCHWMPNEEGVKYANEKIPPRICTHLGVNTRRQETLRKHEMSLFGISFGQREKLTTRLQRILTGYPCDSTILKELLQNADDAEASKICFIKDPRHHPEERVFEDCWKPLQGPALCVYNNSPFTKRDIDGIQNLGEGSKGDDPTKTGQYGIGFNAVYHLTDAPSFISKGDEIGEMMCVFDPHCKFVPGSSKEEPGRGYQDLPRLRKIFTDVFPCYLDEYFPVDNATMFRFPLRNEEMAKMSKISNTVMTADKLDELMCKFKKELFDVLLFVNNVTEVSMCEIDEKTGDLMTDYEVTATLSPADESRRQEFGAHVKEVGCKLREGNISLKEIEKKEVSYTVNLEDSQGSYQRWLVVQRVGFDDKVSMPDCITSAVQKKELGLLPRGGVASLIDSSSRISIPGKAFCFLPLPFETGLPLHINGHFALDHEARRNLWQDEDGGYRGSWNSVLLRFVVAPCYVTLLDKVRGFIELPVDIDQQTNLVCDRPTAEGLIKRFVSFFPSLSGEMYWKTLAKEVYQYIGQRKACLLPVLRCLKRQENHGKAKIQNERVMITWFAPTWEGDNKAFFNDLKQTTATQRKPIITTLVNDSPRKVVSEAKPKEEKLKETLLAVGFNLLEVPMEMCNNFTCSGINVHCVCPQEVLHFFGTYGKREQLCHVGSLPLPLKKTPFKVFENLLLVFKYCKEDNDFLSSLDGLPLLLTQDEMLRVFDAQHPAFLTTHLEITPQSQSQFVHRSLYNRIFYRDGGPAESPVFKVFDISAFAKLLPASLDASIFETKDKYVAWIPNEAKRDKIPSCHWLQQVWRFFSSNIEKDLKVYVEKQERREQHFAYGHRDDDKERKMMEQETSRLVRDALSPVSSWCLIPATETSHFRTRDYVSEIRHILVPLSMAHTVISYSDSFLDNILRKLSLPELNCKIIDDDYNSHNSYSMIARRIVATFDNPRSILSSLEKKLQTCSLANVLTPTECEIMLEYFNKNVGMLTEEDSVTLKKLPFYPTIHDQNISISGKKAIVLPPVVPKDDMNIWEAESGIVFLKHRERLKYLYKFLECTSMNEVDVYCDVIFDKFQDMSAEARLAHLRFLCKTLLELKSPINEKSLKCFQKAERLSAALTDLEFIPLKDGDLKRASSFYDPQNEVFRVMFHDEKERFPREPFSEDEWLPFLRLFGLIHVVSADKFIAFAKEVESEASTSESGATKAKSEALVKHLFTRKNVASETLLRDIRGIHFIFPNKVSKYLTDLCSQYGTKQDGNLRYGCFEESLVPDYETITWTTASLLPHVADPMKCRTFPMDYPFGNILHSYPKYQEEVMSQLKILAKPTMELVVSHCEIICRCIAEKNEETVSKSVEKNTGEITIIKLMNDIYHFLQPNLSLSLSQFKGRIERLQCVVVEGGRRFVFPNQIVIDFLTDQEIRPYLYRIPPDIAAYGEFFQHLGATNTVTASQYASVLERIYQKCGNNKMDPNEIVKSFKATKGLFLKVAQDKESRILELPELYLPGVNRDLSPVMGKSIELVCNDVPHFRERITRFFRLLLVRLQDCNLRVIRDDILVNKLPEHLRPQMLSSLVHENLLDSLKETVSCCGAAQRLKHVLTSNEFCSGFIRLVKHEDYEAGRDTDDNICSVITERLKSIKVYSVSNLCTNLVYQDEVIPESEAGASCFEKRMEEHGQKTWDIYIKDDEALPNFVSRVAEVVNRITGCLLANKLVYLPHMLTISPVEIKSFLDGDKIREDNSIVTLFYPPPGSYIRMEDHHLLVDSFEDFEPGEYVGYEMDDPSLNDEDGFPTYIYAIVIEEVNSEETSSSFATKRYRINIGIDVEPIVVYGVDLYMFHRVKGTPCWERAIYEGAKGKSSRTAEKTIILEEVMAEVTRILEEAWTLPKERKDKTVKRLFLAWHPDKNPGNEELCTKVFQHIQAEISRLERGEIQSDYSNYSYHGSYDNFFTSWRGRAQSHRTQRSTYFNSGCSSNAYRCNPQPREASRWFRQAEADLEAVGNDRNAKSLSNEWACFKCHQAAEKALKAAQFSVDADKTRIHDLRLNANYLDDPTFSSLASSLEGLVGGSARMRYPDCLRFPRIPHDEYNADMARTAYELAQKILERVKERFLRT